MNGNVHIGTSGWSYADWVGSFYPQGTPARDYLACYTGEFDVVEVDSTYYRPPSRKMVTGWAEKTPDHFRFFLKAPGEITHKKVLADYTARTQRPLDHVRDFFDCIRSRRDPVASPEVMYRSMNICLAADICEQLKRSLKFDLHKAEFINDPEANRMRSRAMRVPYTI